MAKLPDDLGLTLTLHTHTRIRFHACARQTHVHTSAHTHTHTHAHTHTHTHTHTHRYGNLYRSFPGVREVKQPGAQGLLAFASNRAIIRSQRRVPCVLLSIAIFSGLCSWQCSQLIPRALPSLSVDCATGDVASSHLSMHLKHFRHGRWVVQLTM